MKFIVRKTSPEGIILSEREFEMKSWHWGTIIVVLIIGYLIGVKFPSTGQSLLGKIGA